MGHDLLCPARVDGKTDHGKALLETAELLFRGTHRVRIPFADIKKATAKNGTLHITWKGGSLELDLGDPLAERWAHKIKYPKSVLEKLGVKPGQKVAAIGITDASFLKQLETLLDTAPARRLAKNADAIFYQADDRAKLTAFPMLRAALAPAGALWIIRPKGNAAITEAETMKAGKAAGLVDVKVVAFSATHTAEKFVIPVKDR